MKSGESWSSGFREEIKNNHVFIPVCNLGTRAYNPGKTLIITGKPYCFYHTLKISAISLQYILKMIFQLSPHTNLCICKSDLAVKSSKVNLLLSLIKLGRASDSYARFSSKAFLVLEKNIFKSFYHI